MLLLSGDKHCSKSTTGCIVLKNNCLFAMSMFAKIDSGNFQNTEKRGAYMNLNIGKAIQQLLSLIHI